MAVTRPAGGAARRSSAFTTRSRRARIVFTLECASEAISALAAIGDCRYEHTSRCSARWGCSGSGQPRTLTGADARRAAMISASAVRAAIAVSPRRTGRHPSRQHRPGEGRARALLALSRVPGSGRLEEPKPISEPSITVPHRSAIAIDWRRRSRCGVRRLPPARMSQSENCDGLPVPPIPSCPPARSAALVHTDLAHSRSAFPARIDSRRATMLQVRRCRAMPCGVLRHRDSAQRPKLADPPKFQSG
jgi:hypothetical protein